MDKLFWLKLLRSVEPRFHSIYDERLQLLSAGYGRNITIDTIPDDIIILCVIWMKEEPQISLKRWFCSLDELSLEIKLSGFATKVLNHQHIGKYQVKRRLKDIFEKTIRKEDEEKMVNCIVSKIYNLNCIAFTKKGDLLMKGLRMAVMLEDKVKVFDKKERMICESPWKTFYDARPMLDVGYIERYDVTKINKYYDENTDINNIT